MVRIFSTDQYLIVAARGEYSLEQVTAKLENALDATPDRRDITLILDIRESTAEPSHETLQAFGEYLGSLRSKITSGVYITSDDLRFGLSNIVLANAKLTEAFGRVKLTALDDVA